MRSKRWLWALAGLLAIAAVAWVVRSRTSPPGGGAAGAARDAQARPVSVAAVAAARRDVPIYLEGLGNVTASGTVTVRTQVDGRLDQVLFREGQSVRRGEVLAQIDPRPFQIQLQQAEGALARDEAQLKVARLNVERDRALVAQKLIAQQQLDTDEATAGQLAGAVEIDRAAIAAARLNLDYARITSPIDGVTGLRQVDPGNLVRATDANGLVVVTRLDPAAVVFSLPQDQLPEVSRELARGPLDVEVFARDSTTKLGAGTLALIDNQINQATSTLRLKAVVPNPARSLWPNQFVNVRLHLATQRGALVVPAPALQRGPSGTFVYVIGPDATAASRPVEVAATQGDTAIVASGLREGEQVVVDGQSQLRPGARVIVREARPGGARGGLAEQSTGGGAQGRGAAADPARGGGQP